MNLYVLGLWLIRPYLVRRIGHRWYDTLVVLMDKDTSRYTAEDIETLSILNEKMKRLQEA